MNVFLLILDIAVIGICVAGLIMPERMYNKGNELDPKQRKVYMALDIICIALLILLLIFDLIPNLG